VAKMTFNNLHPVYGEDGVNVTAVEVRSYLNEAIAIAFEVCIDVTTLMGHQFQSRKAFRNDYFGLIQLKRWLPYEMQRARELAGSL